MDKSKEEILANVKGMFAMEGLELTTWDIASIERCLRGDASFEQEVQAAVLEAMATGKVEAA